jgi:hypothetical protein
MGAAEKYLLLMEEKIPDLYNAGEVDGRYNEWSDFWNSVQNNGNRTDYKRAFYNTGKIWGSTTFKPKYNITCVGDASEMFYDFGLNLPDFDLMGLLQLAGVTLDTSLATSVTQIFAYNRVVTRVPTLDFSNVSALTSVFVYCDRLETVKKIIVSPNTTFSGVFHHCPKLKNLTVGGIIGQNGFDVQRSVDLTHDSLMSIINALADKKGDSSQTWTVTLGATNIAKLTDAEKQIARNKGWALA